MNILLIAALLPAIALMVYVYQKDKVEREPIGLVSRVFVLGALSGFVASFVESVLFALFETIIPGGVLLIVVEYFIGVAAVEEGCKYFCLNTIRKNPEFNYVFDAIVYAVAAALGFAALENIFYVFDGGLDVALTRAIFSVPGHMADGVVMGVFFGLARQRELQGKSAKAHTYYWLAFLLPAIEHGCYDTALSLDSDMFAGLAILLDIAFIAIAFVLVRNVSKNDAPLHSTRPVNQQRPPAPFTPPQAFSQQQSWQQPQAWQQTQQTQQQAQQQAHAEQQAQQQAQTWQHPTQQQAHAEQQTQTWQSQQQSSEPPARYSDGPTTRYSSIYRK